MYYVKIFLLAVITGVMPVGVTAASIDDLPRKWAGTYVDHRVPGTDYFHVVLKEMRVSGDQIIARGKARFFDDDWVTDVSVEWKINTRTREIEILDSDPVGDDENYVTNAVYRGTISRGFDQVIAIWQDLNSLATGTLTLQAVDTLPERVPDRPPLH